MAQELKEHLFVTHSELQEGDELTDAFTIEKSYYIKSEVDAVIEELKIKVKVKTYDIEAARKLNTSYLSDYAEALKRESHHKYKRCLAMAKVCYLRFVRYENYLQKLCASNATIAAYKFRRDMYDKWEKRWLALAEKFKEAK